MKVGLLRNMGSRGVECDRCAQLSPSRPAASSGPRRARPAPDCNSLRAGVFATPLHIDDRQIGLRWRPRARQIARVLDGVFFESKTRQRPREPRLVDMPPRVVALPDAKKTLLHGKLQRRHVSDGATSSIVCTSFSRRGCRRPSHRRTSRRTSLWRPCSWRPSCRRVRRPSLPRTCVSPWRQRLP